jgi:hypothetical protein
MQPFSPSVGFALVASAEKRAVSPVVSPQAVVRVARVVRVVASVTVERRRGAAVAGFCNRGVRGVPSASPVRASSPNMALNLAPSGRWTALKRRRLALR